MDFIEQAETFRNGSMPLGYYTWLGLHSGARLTSKERQDLGAFLSRTLRVPVADAAGDQSESGSG
jgi:hypothetical protein